MLSLILTLLQLSFATTPPKECGVVFDNGHNRPLQAVMQKMQQYEFAINDFVTGLQPPFSKYVSHVSTRNIESLEAIIEVAIKYEKLLAHVAEKAQTTMMSPRIEMKETSQHDSFKQNYQTAYVEYLALVTSLRVELETFRAASPDTWNAATLKDILRTMNTAMGQAHNRF